MKILTPGEAFLGAALIVAFVSAFTAAFATSARFTSFAVFSCILRAAFSSRFLTRVLAGGITFGALLLLSFTFYGDGFVFATVTAVFTGLAGTAFSLAGDARFGTSAGLDG